MRPGGGVRGGGEGVRRERTNGIIGGGGVNGRVGAGGEETTTNRIIEFHFAVDFSCVAPDAVAPRFQKLQIPSKTKSKKKKKNSVQLGKEETNKTP